MSVLRTATAPIRRLPRLPRLLARPVVLALLWGRRHTLLLWARSLTAELRGRRRPDARRLRALLAALVTVTRDGRLTNAPELRRLSLGADDVLEVQADEHWARRDDAVAVLGGVDGVNLVRLTAGRPDGVPTAVPTPGGIVLEPAS